MADIDKITFLRAALTEAGYPNATVFGPADDPQIALSGPDGVPDHVCWQAFEVLSRITGTFHACFECWDQDQADTCTHERVDV